MELNTLSTTQDFAELLSLTQLKTQMGVLGFLQDNLFDYQMNYFKSHLMTFDEMMAYIPEKEKKVFFKKYRDCEYTNNKLVYKPYNEVYLRYCLKSYIETDLFLVNTIDKKVYHFPKQIVPLFKFFFTDGKLVCTYYRSVMVKTFESFNETYSYDSQRTYQLFFDMDKNLLVGHSDETELVNKCYIGYHHSHRDSKRADILF